MFFLLRYNPDMSKILSRKRLEQNRQSDIVLCELATEYIEGIVNVTNQWFRHATDVSRVIVQKGGESLHTKSIVWVARPWSITHDQHAYTHTGRHHRRYIIQVVRPYVLVVR